MRSPNISIPKKDHFSFLGKGKTDNTLFTMTSENIFDAAHPVIEDRYEESKSLDKIKNAGVTTAETTIKIITSPQMK